MPTDPDARPAVWRALGIPYGVAPVGDHRFCAAVAAPSPAPHVIFGSPSPLYDRFGNAPMQAVGGPFSDAVPGMGVGPVGEDCLTLNVWSPATAPDAALPVLVWICGGAFVVGGSSAPTYDGARLAGEQDVVVVTINYRVGAFGFLDLRSVPGAESTDTNCGLRDQRLALQWVVDNIAGFGGDPSRVTVFGESGGGGSIMHLLTTPGIGTVVRQAIVQSPGIDFTQHSDMAAKVTAAVMQRAGAHSVDDLRALTASELLEVQLAVSNQLLFEIGTMVFHPVVDDQFVTATPSVAISAGAASDVGLLIGYTADEMRLFPDPRADTLGRAGMAAWTRTYLTARMATDPGLDVADRLVGAYLDAAVSTPRSTGSDVWAAINADGIMRQPVLRVAETRGGPAPTFVYQFDWQAKNTDRDLGAFHAIDLPFVFDAFDVDGWGSFLGVDDAGRSLGVAMRCAWAAFAASGDPSSAALGTWPPYGPERETMVLDATSGVVADPIGDQRRRWDGLWSVDSRPAGVAL